jgi:hypothetical protein
VTLDHILELFLPQNVVPVVLVNMHQVVVAVFVLHVLVVRFLVLVQKVVQIVVKGNTKMAIVVAIVEQENIVVKLDKVLV